MRTGIGIQGGGSMGMVGPAASYFLRVNKLRPALLHRGDGPRDFVLNMGRAASRGHF
ncbi:MAG: hypothetical protein ACLTDR_10935 [Adlercreutzia equolifaciens]